MTVLFKLEYIQDGVKNILHTDSEEYFEEVKRENSETLREPDDSTG